MYRISYILILIFSLTWLLTVSAQKQISSDFCIFPEELELLHMINDYRATFNKPEINLSNSLCYVAYLHNHDLIQNHPDTGICNMHSWSDNNEWTPCCYHSKTEDKSCLFNKPAELTNFPGSGYELIYWDSKFAKPRDAFDLWRTTNYSRDILLNEGKWSEELWSAAGVSVEDDYVILWLSTFDDVEHSTRICNSDKTIPYFKSLVDTSDFFVNTRTGRYYLIVSSLTSMEEALEVRNTYAKQGFPLVKLILNEDRIRVALDAFISKESAIKRKNQLINDFPDCWILQY